MKDNVKPIMIPEELYKKLERKVSEEDDFNSVDDYVFYLLKQLLSADLENIQDEEEEKEIKERLKKLGYL